MRWMTLCVFALSLACAAGKDADDADNADDVEETGPTCSPTGTGYEVGDVAYDLSAEDQERATWSLYDHCDERILLVFGLAEDGVTQSIAARFDEEGVTLVIALLDENMAAAERSDWADARGTRVPVLSGLEATFLDYSGPDYVPWFVAYDEGSEIAYIGPDDEDALAELR